MNYYVILGIRFDASREEIKDAYRKMVKKYHPDHFGEDSSTFLKVQEAYQVLSDPVQRKKYDQSVFIIQPPKHSTTSQKSSGFRPKPEPLIPQQNRISNEPISLSRSFHTHSPSFDELFDRLLLKFGQGIRRKSEMPENLGIEIAINPEEALNGGTLKLMIPFRIQCPLCLGAGQFGFWGCERCGSLGIMDIEIPLIVSYPGGIKNRLNQSISLTKYGINNIYLTISIRVSEETG